MKTSNNNKRGGNSPFLNHRHHCQSLSKGLIKSVESIKKEFTNGFRFVSGISGAVAVFGSGRFEKDNRHYKEAAELANLLAKEGFAIITGGGPGIMEAANKGAYQAGGQSVGLNIIIPNGQDYNVYVKSGMRLNYFFTRKVMFAVAADYYVFFPGGFGTLDEFFEMVNLIHNRKIKNPPLLIAVGRDYWQPLFDFLEKVVYKQHRAIERKDFNIVYLANSPREALEIIKKTRR